ncbi:MAG TPA: hypothetical protein DC057_12415 [Spirochaetia bacterium]|nr:hypothetical protein [Spirochaetia bacterium]
MKKIIFLILFLICIVYSNTNDFDHKYYLDFNLLTDINFLSFDKFNIFLSVYTGKVYKNKFLLLYNFQYDNYFYKPGSYGMKLANGLNTRFLLNRNKIIPYLSCNYNFNIHWYRYLYSSRISDENNNIINTYYYLMKFQFEIIPQIGLYFKLKKNIYFDLNINYSFIVPSFEKYYFKKQYGTTEDDYQYLNFRYNKSSIKFINSKTITTKIGIAIFI